MYQSKRGSGRALCVVALASSLTGGIVFGQEAPGPETGARAESSGGETGSERALDTLVEALGRASFAERESAQQQLISSNSVTLEWVERWLRNKRDELSAEQRERLVAVGRTRFMNSERAALGVQFSFALPDRAVIERTFKPFDSERVLQPGDIIVEIDGATISGTNSQLKVRGVIFSHDPGDEIPIKVRRGEQLIEDTVRLGRYGDLNQANAALVPGAVPVQQRLSDVELLAAWRVRSSRFAGKEQGIRAAVNPEDWRSDSTTDRVRRMRFRKIDAGEQIPPEVAAGGTPRAALSLDPIEQDRQVAGMIVRVQAMPQQIERELRRKMTPAEELAKMVLLRRNMADELRRKVAELSTRKPTDDELMKSVAELETRIAALDRTRAAIERELTERGVKIPEPVQADAGEAEEEVEK